MGWDISKPGDSDIVSQYPANERQQRAAVRDIFDVEHVAADGATQGYHKALTLTNLAGDLTVSAGSVGIWQDAGVLKGRVGTGAVTELGTLPGVGFPSGTRMVFQQTAAPTGWTKDTSENDRALRVVSGAVGSGGTQSLASFTPAGTVAGHALTTSEMPSHNHGIPHAVANNPGLSQIGGIGDGGSARSRFYFNRVTSNSGSGSSHAHVWTGTETSIRYWDVIVAQKD